MSAEPNNGREQPIALTDAPAALLRQVSQLTRDLAAERRRSTELDGRLGYALLTIGRLRGALRAAGLNPDNLFGADVKTDEGPGDFERVAPSKSAKAAADTSLPWSAR